MQNSKKLTILIPNYSGAKFIAQTINQFQDAFPSAHLVVVDDCSPDKSVEVIKKTQAYLIEREKNGGFAASVNTGLRSFISSDNDFVLVANSDIEMSRAAGDETVKALSRFDEIDNLGVLGFVEDVPDEVGLKEGADISGFLFMLSRNVIEKIGYLDETFYMYGEEQDYFRRVLEFDFKISQTGIRVTHNAEGSGISKLANSWYAIRNSIFLELKRFNFALVLKKIVNLFLLINHLRRHKVKNDPSLNRVRRPGFFLGNIFLLYAVMWNFFQLLKLRNR